MGKKTIISVTVDPEVAAKLPKRGRSVLVNAVLREHFSKEKLESGYEAFLTRISRDERFLRLIRAEAVRGIQEERG